MKTRRRIKKWKRKKKEGIRVSSWWRVNQTCREVGPIAGKKAVWPRHHFFQQRQKLLDWCGVESPSPTSYRVVSYKRNLSLGTVPGSKSLQLDGLNLEQPLKSANMAEEPFLEERRYSRVARCEYIWIIISSTAFYFTNNGQTVSRAKDTFSNN